MREELTRCFGRVVQRRCTTLLTFQGLLARRPLSPRPYPPQQHPLPRQHSLPAPWKKPFDSGRRLGMATPAAAQATLKYKLVFLGDQVRGSGSRGPGAGWADTALAQSVGKTSIITRFMYDKFDNTYQVRRFVAGQRPRPGPLSLCARPPSGSTSSARRCTWRTALCGCSSGARRERPAGAGRGAGAELLVTLSFPAGILRARSASAR